MQFKKLVPLFVLIAVGLFFSCQKEEEIDGFWNLEPGRFGEVTLTTGDATPVVTVIGNYIYVTVVDKNTDASGVSVRLKSTTDSTGRDYTLPRIAANTYSNRVQWGIGTTTSSFLAMAPGDTITAEYLETLLNKQYVASKVVDLILTVNNGTGGGKYVAGQIVPIVANPPAVGYFFYRWIGTTNTVADVTATSTTVTIYNAPMIISAMYSEVSNDLTVVKGSGSGRYSNLQVVNIVANAPGTNSNFYRWVGNTATVADINSSSTTFTINYAPATITATYVEAPRTCYLQCSSTSFVTTAGVHTISVFDTFIPATTNNLRVTIRSVTSGNQIALNVVRRPDGIFTNSFKLSLYSNNPAIRTLKAAHNDNVVMSVTVPFGSVVKAQTNLFTTRTLGLFTETLAHQTEGTLGAGNPLPSYASLTTGAFSNTIETTAMAAEGTVRGRAYLDRCGFNFFSNASPTNLSRILNGYIHIKLRTTSGSGAYLSILARDTAKRTTINASALSYIPTTTSIRFIDYPNTNSLLYTIGDGHYFSKKAPARVLTNGGVDLSQIRAIMLHTGDTAGVSHVYYDDVYIEY